MNNLIPIEHKNQRVLTTQQLADGYEAEPIKIQQNFHNNFSRYCEGTHYFILESEELRRFKSNLENFEVAPNVSRMLLWTEKGALLHAKSLNTDRAWEVYNELVDTYFRAKELKPLTALEALAQTVQVLQEQEARIKSLESTQQAIKDAVIAEPDNWREDIQRKLNKIAQAIGVNQYQEVRSESYKLLEQRAGVNLERRLDNKKVRMLKEGASPSAIKNTRKIDVIDEDKKLREIYGKIVSEYFIKYVA